MLNPFPLSMLALALVWCKRCSQEQFQTYIRKADNQRGNTSSFFQVLMRQIPQKNSDCPDLGHVSIAAPILMVEELVSALCYVTLLLARSVGYQEWQTRLAGSEGQFTRRRRLLLWEDYASNYLLYRCTLNFVMEEIQPNTPEYTFFSRAYGTFSRGDLLLGHKTNPNKF